MPRPDVRRTVILRTKRCTKQFLDFYGSSIGIYYLLGISIALGSLWEFYRTGSTIAGISIALPNRSFDLS